MLVVFCGFRFFFFVFFSLCFLLVFFPSPLSIAIPRLSELLSELLWRVVEGTLGVDIAVDYLASDQPFQKRLGDDGGDGGGAMSPLVELLCDTLWGVDAMVRKEGFHYVFAHILWGRFR